MRNKRGHEEQSFKRFMLPLHNWFKKGDFTRFLHVIELYLIHKIACCVDTFLHAVNISGKSVYLSNKKNLF